LLADGYEYSTVMCEYIRKNPSTIKRSMNDLKVKGCQKTFERPKVFFTV
jgi:hypothetical protein